MKSVRGTQLPLRRARTNWSQGSKRGVSSRQSTLPTLNGSLVHPLIQQQSELYESAVQVPGGKPRAKPSAALATCLQASRARRGGLLSSICRRHRMQDASTKH
jgi:hypothetical protein